MQQLQFRIGQGHDLHRLENNLPLIIGGVLIPHSKGAVGHSDADALIHAIIDAVLGALCYKNIGILFPDNDLRFKGISSLSLLKNISLILGEKQYKINNIDSTVILERPKLNGYIKSMRCNLSEILNININQISIKAKTNEGMDSVGTGNAIIADAIVLLEYNKNG